MSAAVYTGPFSRITNVHWSVNDRWVLLEGARGVPDVHYTGESDMANATPDRATTGFTTIGTFIHEADAETAWTPYDGTVDPGTTWHQLLHWTKSTDSPTPPVDYDDPAWVLVHEIGGYLSAGAAFGRLLDNITPDPNCPPQVYSNVGLLWASGAAALNYLAYQQSLTTVHNSFTVTSQPYGGSLSYDSCTPGTP